MSRIKVTKDENRTKETRTKDEGSRTRCPGSRYGYQEKESRTKEIRTKNEGSRTRCPGSR